MADIMHPSPLSYFLKNSHRNLVFMKNLKFAVLKPVQTDYFYGLPFSVCIGHVSSPVRGVLLALAAKWQILRNIVCFVFDLSTGNKNLM